MLVCEKASRLIRNITNMAAILFIEQEGLGGFKVVKEPAIYAITGIWGNRMG
jgi:hypothetical protein